MSADNLSKNSDAREKSFTGLFTRLLTRSRLFLTVLYEWKKNLRSERSFVPNQALYQAEPQPEKQIVCTGLACRCAPYFAYLTADSKQIEPMAMVHLILAIRICFEIRISGFEFQNCEL
jgi:hypothetical protein